MKRVLLTLGIVLTLQLSTVFAQQMPEPIFEEYLEEKVRDERIREFIIEHKEAHEAGTQNELQTIDQFMSSIEMDTDEPEERAEYTFSGGAEPYIAIHPTNSNVLVASYMEAGGNFEYPVYYSNDGGATWTQSTFSTSAELQNWFQGDNILGGGDPVLAFDDDGTVHMTWIYLHGQGFTFNAGMFYAYSSDAGQTWTVPTDTADHVIHDGDLFSQDMLDRQWMHVDNSGGANDGDLYMSAIYFGGSLGGAGEVVLKKDVSATGFNTSNIAVAVPITANEGAQFGNVKVDANGTVHLGCIKFDSGSGAGDVMYTQSTDGGQTWSTPLALAPATTSLPNGGTHLVHGRDNSASSLAVDGNNVYMAWSDMANNTVRGFYTYSNDGGMSFSTPDQFGSNLIGPEYYHLMPNVAAGGGNMSISWYVVDSTSMATTYYMAHSDDNGATFSRVGQISTGITDFANEDSQDFYGDYNSSVKDGCITHSIWGDGRTGSPVVYHAAVDGCTALGLAEQTPLNGGLQVSKIYPNPVNDNVTVEINLESSSTFTVELISVDGKAVQKLFSGTKAAGKSLVTADLSEVAAGQYLVRVTLDNGVFATRSLVKQ